MLRPFLHVIVFKLYHSGVRCDCQFVGSVVAERLAHWNPDRAIQAWAYMYELQYWAKYLTYLCSYSAWVHLSMTNFSALTHWLWNLESYESFAGILVDVLSAADSLVNSSTVATLVHHASTTYITFWMETFFTWIDSHWFHFYSDLSTLQEHHIVEGSKLHLSIRKPGNAAGSGNPDDFFKLLREFLRGHFSEQDTERVMQKFREVSYRL